MTDLTNPIFSDEDLAREWLETARWPDGVCCPHCGVYREATRLSGDAHRKGLWECRACRRQFSVTVGSVMERSHVPLTKWALAFHLMAASKKGISAHQMHRMLKVTYKTAWFMCHRIREAMTDKTPSPIGGEGKVVVPALLPGGRAPPQQPHGKKESPMQSKPTTKTVVGHHVLDEAIKPEFQSIIDDCRKFSAKRNTLVHSSWIGQNARGAAIALRIEGRHNGASVGNEAWTTAEIEKLASDLNQMFTRINRFLIDHGWWNGVLFE